MMIQGTLITLAEERLMVHSLKRSRKMLNVGELLELCNKYKQVNQWK